MKFIGINISWRNELNNLVSNFFFLYFPDHRKRNRIWKRVQIEERMFRGDSGRATQWTYPSLYRLLHWRKFTSEVRKIIILFRYIDYIIPVLKGSEETISLE